MWCSQKKNSRLLNVIFDKIGGSYGRPVRIPCRIISMETSRGRDSFSDTELQKWAGGKGWGLPGPWVVPAVVPGWPFNLIPSHSHGLKTDKMWETVTAPSALLTPPSIYWLQTSVFSKPSLWNRDSVCNRCSEIRPDPSAFALVATTLNRRIPLISETMSRWRFLFAF